MKVIEECLGQGIFVQSFDNFDLDSWTKLVSTPFSIISFQAKKIPFCFFRRFSDAISLVDCLENDIEEFFIKLKIKFPVVIFFVFYE
jgi:hypothetical protein